MHRLIEAVASVQMVKKERHGTINVNGVMIAFVKKYTFSGFGIMYLKIIRNVTAIFLHRAAFCTSSVSPQYIIHVFLHHVILLGRFLVFHVLTLRF